MFKMIANILLGALALVVVPSVLALLGIEEQKMLVLSSSTIMSCYLTQGATVAAKDNAADALLATTGGPQFATSTDIAWPTHNCRESPTSGKNTPLQSMSRPSQSTFADGTPCLCLFWRLLAAGCLG